MCKPAANPGKQSLANSTPQDTARKQNAILMFYSPQSRINFVTAGVFIYKFFFSLLEGRTFEWVGYLGEIDLPQMQLSKRVGEMQDNYCCMFIVHVVYLAI